MFWFYYIKVIKINYNLLITYYAIYQPVIIGPEPKLKTKRVTMLGS